MPHELGLLHLHESHILQVASGTSRAACHRPEKEAVTCDVPLSFCDRGLNVAILIHFTVFVTGLSLCLLYYLLPDLSDNLLDNQRLFT